MTVIIESGGGAKEVYRCVKTRQTVPFQGRVSQRLFPGARFTKIVSRGAFNKDCYDKNRRKSFL